MKNKGITEVDGKFYMKAKVVMLPTKDRKAPLHKYVDGCIYGTQKIINPLAEVNFQHLYFLSDEEIKEGDWYYDTLTTLIYKADERPVTMNCFKKIIASTDESLDITCISGEEKYRGSLPRPSNEFLQAYCKANGEIDEVLIELEYQPKLSVENPPIEYFKLKVSPDNTITIKKVVEENISQHDMFLNMQYYYEHCILHGYITPQKWIEEHKHF